MKKICLIICLVFAFVEYSNAQLQFGLKGGVNYNSNSFKEVSTDVLSGAEGKSGYHGGIWMRVKIPGIGLYIRPELIYTNLENTLKVDNVSSDFSLQKIDIPVLLGKKIFGVGNIFAGPSFQYILGSEFGIDTISEVETKDFSMGIQLGGGVEFGSFGIDLRWERSLSNVESNIVNSLGNDSISYDTRINQIIIGISYKL